MMTESKRILTRDDYPIQGKVYFRQEDEEGENGGVPLTELTMTADDWDQFGQPNTITVSIKPGDHLNLPGETLASSSEHIVEATEVPKPRVCSKCKAPEDNHPYRHPFVSVMGRG